MSSFFELEPDRLLDMEVRARARDFLFPPGSMLADFLGTVDPEGKHQEKARAELLAAVERVAGLGVPL